MNDLMHRHVCSVCGTGWGCERAECIESDEAAEKYGSVIIKVFLWLLSGECKRCRRDAAARKVVENEL